MDCNKDEAAKAKELAEKKFQEKDIMGARKLALKAQTLFPSLDGIPELLTTLNVHVSAERKINGEVDWYGVLGVDPSSEDETVKKHYRKLALTLHPDKNKSVGAEGAFKILSEAWSLLSDKSRRDVYDQKRNSRGIYQKVTPNNLSKAAGRNGFRPPTNNGNLNKTRNYPNPHSAPVDSQRRKTFWTQCKSCKMQFEYVLLYLNKRLECYSCKEPFIALEIPPPQMGHQPPWSSHTPPLTPSNAGGSGAVQTTNGVRFPSENANRLHEDAQGERLKRRRHTTEQRTNDCGVEKIDQLARGSEIAGPGNSYGIPSGVGSRRLDSTRELSLLEIRNMLTAKAMTEICKKLNEWENIASTQKVSNKDTGLEEAKKTKGKGFVKNGAVHLGDNPDTQGSSMIVPDPDFHDFDSDRTVITFGDNEVWAAYDDDDGMPRFYAMIHNVISRKPLKMRISWLNSKSNAEFGPMNWVRSGFFKTSGEFRIGQHKIYKSANAFSHKVKWTKGARGAIRIYPSKGDVWALYSNWTPDWNEHTLDEMIHQYDMVEVLDDYNEETGVTVIPLVKVTGFKTVFRQHTDRKQARIIPREEMFRFSHQVPSSLLTGQESPNAPAGCLELDPAAIRVELLQVIPESPEK